MMKRLGHSTYFNKWLWMIGVCLLVLDGFLLYGMGLKNRPQAGGEIYSVIPIGKLSQAEAFDKEQIKRLQKENEAYWISYECCQDEEVQNMGKQAKIHIVTTNADYNKVYGLQMQSGHFFMEDAEATGKMVLDRRAAFQLFGSIDCLGETIQYGGMDWQIIGIAENKEKDEKQGYIYILGSGLQEQIAIQSIRVRSDEGLNSQTKADIKKMLIETGHDEKHYKILSLSGYQRQIGDWWLLYLQGLGIIGLLLIIVLIANGWRKEVQELQEIRKEVYLSNYIGQHMVAFSIKGLVSLVVFTSLLMGVKALTYKALVKICAHQRIAAKLLNENALLQNLNHYNTLGKLGCLIGLMLVIIGSVAWCIDKVKTEGNEALRLSREK